ncbi:uncharacterized protein DUF4296 [Bacteroides zoogleoformans]|uniref:DUF4296 domain-containing protein n=1 Tax=Bacteroides zoogleoformans TaxID=28119 RepID=A0ABM6TAV8_9BACE|nr:DUF4296 domain-containing protein [Bacteroides zoogleoformans]AVM53451.1 DUF4296 domain-containing protein [Bacteroides zoogleoformans]TWJ17215.1 uncharacterized protein DUF4296 [Bacteroides zoogleoformans]
MKRRNRVQWYGILLLTCSLAACQVKRPDYVLQDSRMEEVLYDYHIAKAMGEEVPYNENYKRVLYIESVFKKHGITQADFDSSMVWFARNPETLVKIYEKVNLRLKAERDGINHLIAMRDNKPKESLPGDSIDVWAWQHIYQLTGMSLDNKMIFILPADTNFHDRDTLRWNVRFRFCKGMPDERRDSVHAPFMAMQILYEQNDSVIGATQKIMKEGPCTISLYADKLGKIKEVRGFIYYPVQKNGRSLLADHISLMRYHAKDSLTITPTDSLQQASDSTLKDSIEQQSADSRTPENEEVDTDGKEERRNIRPRPTLKEIEKASR